MPRRPSNTTELTSSIDGSGDDSDFEKKLQDARDARARVKQNRAKRKEKRVKVEAEYTAAMSGIRDRIDKTYKEYHTRLLRLREARLSRLVQALEVRDGKQKEIASKLKDAQQQANNLGVQLLDLYHARGADASQPIDEELGKPRENTRRA